MSATFACTLMIAWWTRTTAILQWPMHDHPIVFNTALGFAATGAAMVGLYLGYRWLVVAVGGFDLLLGLLVIFEHAMGRGVGIDQLLANAYLSQPGATPGQMAVNTAACFALFGAALLVFGLGRGRWLGAVLTAVGSSTAAIALLSLFGWASDVPTASAWGRATAMAVPTAMLLVVISAGLIAFAWMSPHRNREWLAMPIGAAALGAAAMMWLALTNRGVQEGTLSSTTATRAVVVLAVLMATLVAGVVWMGLRAEQGKRAAEAETKRRAEAERALRASETRLFQMLEAMPMGIFVASSDGRPYYANAEAVRLLGDGVRPDAGGDGAPPIYPLYAEGSDKLYPAEDVALIRALRGEPVDLDDVEIHHPEAGTIPVEVRGRPIFASDHHVEYGLVVFDDISGRKAAERSLAEQAAVLDLAYDAILVVDADHIIRSWNHGAELTYGFTKAEAIGKSAIELLRTEYPIALDQIEAELEAIGTWQGELLQRRRGGERIVVASRWAIRRGTDGSRTGSLEINRDISVQKEAASYARSLIEASLDPLVTISPDGKITDVNESTIRATGIPREQLVGTDFSEYFTDPAKAREGYQRVFAEGTVTDFPLTMRHRSGALTEVLYNASVYRDRLGNVLGVFAAARDVTAQRQAASYARSLIEASLDPLVTISADGKITDVNESTVQATGVPRDQLIGTDFSEYFTEPEKAREGYQRVFAEGQVTDYPLTMRHRSAKLMEVVYNASLYRDTMGKVRGVFAAARDVTAQRQAAMYARSLIEASLDPLVTISAAGKITDVNESTVRATGVERDELIGTDFSEYFTEPEKAREGYQRVFAEGMVTDYPLTIRHRDGRLLDVVYNASLYRDTMGNVLGVFAAARDVTARKRAEQELARRATELEIANRDLGRSNADLEQFAYIASHDLAEPLRAISGPISLVARRYRGQIDEEADEFIGFAVDGCQRMQSLIDGLLAFSRVGRLEGSIDAVDADKVAHEAVSALSPILAREQAEVTIEALPTVLVERDQLSQVFQNLIGNAVKFVAPGTAPLVKISSEAVGDMWRIDVTDNGIGIEPEYRERIFAMFKRLHGRDEYPGTGIGLALVKKIIERHGGEVGVDAAPTGTGSRFWFTLPQAGGQDV